MLRDITLGQFFPGNSPIHRLDPRGKILILLVYIIALFTAANWTSYGLVFLFLAVALGLSRISVKTVLAGLKPVVVILLFTAVLNVFFTGGKTVLFSFWKLTVTKEGLIRAAFMVARIMLLIVGTLLLTYTTSPISLTDGLEALLSPLKAIHVPVHELSMMMCIALRFIPTLIEETDKIISAQKARGGDFETGSLGKRLKALVPVMVPLFISAFRRADELATAMECRCYRGGEGRTKMKILRFSSADIYSLSASVLLLGGVVAFRIFGL